MGLRIRLPRFRSQRTINEFIADEMQKEFGNDPSSATAEVRPHRTSHGVGVEWESGAKRLAKLRSIRNRAVKADLKPRPQPQTPPTSIHDRLLVSTIRRSAQRRHRRCPKCRSRTHRVVCTQCGRIWCTYCHPKQCPWPHTK